MDWVMQCGVAGLLKPSLVHYTPTFCQKTDGDSKKALQQTWTSCSHHSQSLQDTEYLMVMQLMSEHLVMVIQHYYSVPSTGTLVQRHYPYHPSLSRLPKWVVPNVYVLIVKQGFSFNIHISSLRISKNVFWPYLTQLLPDIPCNFVSFF